MAYNRPNDGLNAAQRYAQKLGVVTIRPRKEDAEMVRSAAEKSGLSITQFVLAAVREYIKNHEND